MPTKAAADYYIWRPPGGEAEIHLRFEVIDQINIEVMKGFGAVRKRGAEVGGLLLGSLDSSGDRPIVVIDSFEAVPCEYAFGPSYILSDNDLAGLRDVLDEFEDADGRQPHAVGVFRSHTRDGLALDSYDVQLFINNFNQHNVFLLIKPYATRAAEAGFFVLADGQTKADQTDLQFAFRRKELGGGESPSTVPKEFARPRANVDFKAATVERETKLNKIPFPERPPLGEAGPGHESPRHEPTLDGDDRPAYKFEAAQVARADTGEPQSGLKNMPWGTRVGWLLVLLMLLLFAALAGAQYGPAFLQGRSRTGNSEPYQLGLSATRTNDSVMVRWDRGSPAVRAAKKGLLTISEGSDARSVTLDAAQLGNGLVLYRHVAPEITFKLEVYVGDRNLVTESLIWHEARPVGN